MPRTRRASDEAQRDCRRGRRALPRGPGRRAGLPARRARDPRERPRRCASTIRPGTRDPAAVRAAVGGRAGPRVPAGPRQRRIVLATNVAETSLTVPRHPLRGRHRAGARQALQHRNKVEQLHVEPISQAAAQPARRALRAGRARRLHPALRRGRIHDARPAFTDPEILRSSLAGVILRMTVAAARRHRGLSRSSIRPTPRAIADGYRAARRARRGGRGDRR